MYYFCTVSFIFIYNINRRPMSGNWHTGTAAYQTFLDNSSSRNL